VTGPAVQPVAVPAGRGAAAAGPSGDRGSATVLVISLCAVLVLLATVLVTLGSVAVVRHRAAGAADAGALAAAARALSGSTAACRKADEVVRAQAAQLLSCGLAGDVAEVVVQVRPGGWLGTLGTVSGRARAGPGTTVP